MNNPIKRFCNWMSHAGIATAHSKREKSTIVLLNRAWFIVMVVQVSCLVSHIINGLERSAIMTGVYVLGLLSVHILMRLGNVNAAKITAIVVINANTLAMAYLLGEHTQIINFLLLTTIMPLYLFETKQRKLIFTGILLGVIPYAVYYNTLPYMRHLALPLAEQLNVYKTTVWVMVCSLCALLFLLYHKNSIYEQETTENEKQLIGQKKFYERILEQIPVDIVTFDKELKYTYINSAAIKDAQLREWMIGKTNADYVKHHQLDPQIAEERDNLLRMALANEGKVEVEETFIDRQGEIHYNMKGATPIYNEEHSEVMAIIGYSLNITEIKQAEQKLREYARELEQKNEDLQRFVNATKHDLKSPLRTIASYLQLLERKNHGLLDEDSQSLITSAVSSVKHLDKLISDIYNYTLADKRYAEQEVTDLNEVLDSVIIRMKETITRKNAFIKHGHLPTLKVCASHFGMIFCNLLNNALKYNTAEQPVVIIECRETAEEYIISVADNGIGIEPQYAQQIFELFKRLHTLAEYEGTGVGLAICKRVVESYHGNIWVENNPEGGSVFYLRFPKNMVEVSAPEHNQNLGVKMALTA